MFKGIFIYLIVSTLFCSLLKAESNYEKIGKGEPVILIQGLGCSADIWDAAINNFRHQYSFYKIHIPGFAGVEAIENFNSEVIEQLILEIISKEKLKRVILIGHSFGGFAALKFSTKHSENISKLIIIDSYPFVLGIMNPAITREQAIQQGQILKQTLSSMKEGQYNNYIKSSIGMMLDDKNNSTKVINWQLNSDKRSLLDAQSEMISTDLRNELNKIKSKTLVLSSSVLPVLQGVNKSIFLSNVKNIYKNLLNCKIVFTDKVKHFMMLDDPQWFYQNISEFLSNE